MKKIIIYYSFALLVSFVVKKCTYYEITNIDHTI